MDVSPLRTLVKMSQNIQWFTPGAAVEVKLIEVIVYKTYGHVLRNVRWYKTKFIKQIFYKMADISNLPGGTIWNPNLDTLGSGFKQKNIHMHSQGLREYFSCATRLI